MVTWPWTNCSVSLILYFYCELTTRRIVLIVILVRELISTRVDSSTSLILREIRRSLPCYWQASSQSSTCTDSNVQEIVWNLIERPNVSCYQLHFDVNRATGRYFSPGPARLLLGPYPALPVWNNSRSLIPGPSPARLWISMMCPANEKERLLAIKQVPGGK